MSGRDPLDDALAQLPEDAPGPPDLESRVVAALRARGLLAPLRRRGFVRGLVAAGVMLGAFSLGRETTRLAVSPAEAPGQLFLLLLSPLPDEIAAPPSAEVEARRVAEYRDWARDLASEGRLVSAERLSAQDLTIDAEAPGRVSTTPRGVGPSGFFLIRASHLDDALEIARTCPHLRHGGRLSLRPVDPT